MFTYPRLLISTLLLLSFSYVYAQQDSISQQNSFKFGIGLLSGLTLNKHPPRVPTNDPLGFEVTIGSFIEKKLLENLSATFGANLSFIKSIIGNRSLNYMMDQDSFILVEDKEGDVHISSLRLKIPLRLRLYYLTQEKFRIFAEPGIFVITELKSSRNYTFQKTTFYDPLSQMYFNPPRVESLEELIEVNEKGLGLSFGMGVEWNTNSRQTYVLNAQYQRAGLYFEPRKSVILHLFALEFRFLFHKKKRT